jgi:hypothetical protein
VRDLDDFQTLVLPFAAGAPEPLIFRCLRDAATDFCQRTKLWRCTDSIQTTGAYPEDIPVPPDSVLYEIASCAMGDTPSAGTDDQSCARPLDPITLPELAKKMPDWRTRDIGCEGARWYVSPERGTIQAVPRTAGVLLVEYVCKPAATATTLPDFLLDEYGQTIADGAAGALLIMPNQSFANPQLGAALTQRFQSKLDSLSNAGVRGQQAGRTRTRGRYL